MIWCMFILGLLSLPTAILLAGVSLFLWEWIDWNRQVIRARKECTVVNPHWREAACVGWNEAMRKMGRSDPPPDAWTEEEP